MLVPRAARRDVPEAPPVTVPTAEGGGGITFAANELPDPLPELRVVAAATAGGGGTTSCAPKILPITELRKEVFGVAAGGGGTTAS
jgi:hypothetical protein